MTNMRPEHGTARELSSKARPPAKPRRPLPRASGIVPSCNGRPAHQAALSVGLPSIALALPAYRTRRAPQCQGDRPGTAIRKRHCHNDASFFGAKVLILLSHATTLLSVSVALGF